MYIMTLQRSLYFDLVGLERGEANSRQHQTTTEGEETGAYKNSIYIYTICLSLTKSFRFLTVAELAMLQTPLVMVSMMIPC